MMIKIEFVAGTAIEIMRSDSAMKMGVQGDAVVSSLSAKFNLTL